MKSGEELWRVFVAVELPADIRKRISHHIDQLRLAFPDVRASWTRAENLHLTLKFLGNVSVARLPAISGAAEAAAKTVNRFDLTVNGCGSFPPNGRPKVLWVGINDPSDNLHRLYPTLEDRCADAGFERDARSYHPHLTLARLRAAGESRVLAERHKELGFRSEPVTVSELVVFRSVLRSEGSLHTAISRHGLGESRSIS